MTIIDNFVSYSNKNGGIPSEWYTGIASNAKERLGQHNALSTQWILDNAGSDKTARDIEDYMHDVVGTQGEGGGGDPNTTWAYCYKITSSTKEDA